MCCVHISCSAAEIGPSPEMRGPAEWPFQQCCHCGGGAARKGSPLIAKMHERIRLEGNTWLIINSKMHFSALERFNLSQHG